MRITYNLDVIHQQYAEAVGGDEVTCVAGEKEFHFPHPLFTPDDLKPILNDAEGDSDVAKALLGDQYPAFKKAGGRDADISLLYGALSTQVQSQIGGIEPTPTRS